MWTIWLILVFMIIVLICYTANAMIIVGVFGDDGEEDCG